MLPSKKYLPKSTHICCSQGLEKYFLTLETLSE